MKLSELGAATRPRKKHNQVWWHKTAASYLRAAFAAMDRMRAAPEASSAHKKALAEAEQSALNFCLSLYLGPFAPAKALGAVAKASKGKLSFPKSHSRGKYDSLVRDIDAKVAKGKTWNDAFAVEATRWLEKRKLLSKLKPPEIKDAVIRRAKELGHYKRRRPKQIATAHKNRGKE